MGILITGLWVAVRMRRQQEARETYAAVFGGALIVIALVAVLFGQENYRTLTEAIDTHTTDFNSGVLNILANTGENVQTSPCYIPDKPIPMAISSQSSALTYAPPPDGDDNYRYVHCNRGKRVSSCMLYRMLLFDPWANGQYGTSDPLLVDDFKYNTDQIKDPDGYCVESPYRCKASDRPPGSKINIAIQQVVAQGFTRNETISYASHRELFPAHDLALSTPALEDCSVLGGAPLPAVLRDLEGSRAHRAYGYGDRLCRHEPHRSHRRGVHRRTDDLLRRRRPVRRLGSSARRGGGSNLPSSTAHLACHRRHHGPGCLPALRLRPGARCIAGDHERHPGRGWLDGLEDHPDDHGGIAIWKILSALRSGALSPQIAQEAAQAGVLPSRPRSRPRVPGWPCGRRFSLPVAAARRQYGRWAGGRAGAAVARENSPHHPDSREYYRDVRDGRQLGRVPKAAAPRRP